MRNLEIKNYDNFKDLSYFIGQHKKALGMMDEVQNFYLSFLKSKLVNPNAISKWPGKLIHKETLTSHLLWLSKYSTDVNIPVEEARTLVKEGRTSELIGREVTINLKSNSSFIEKSVKGTISKIDSVERFYGTDFRITGQIDLKKPIGHYHYAVSTNGCTYRDSADDGFITDSIKQIIGKNNINWKDIRKDFKNIYNDPKLQDKFKELAEANAKKRGINDWYVEDPESGELMFFSHDDQLDKYTFEVGKNPNDEKDKKEYLLITKSWKTSGNETDRWKTFFREYIHIHGIMFDTLNGNFAGFIRKQNMIVNRQLNVHNHWHPDDD